MFLTTLVADAAAQHGHEFSTSRPTTPGRLSPLPRAIRPQSALLRTRPALVNKSVRKPASTGEVARGEKVMFKEEAEVKLVENLRRSLEESSEEDSQRPSSIEMALSGRRPIDVPAAKKKPKKELRPKTSYTIAHTAARVNALHKLKSRPPAVLQLHQVAAGVRPRPAYEVFSSGRYAKKLGRDLSRLHKGRDKLGTDDVVLCKAHEYDAHEDDWESHEVVGIVYASYKDERHASGNAQLCLRDGSSWEAVPHARGRFDFVSTDDHGITRIVRWVPRRVRSKQRASISANAPLGTVAPLEEVVYRFSTIDPETRRHPVIATMTPTDLEISDTYYMPRSTSQAGQEDATMEDDDSYCYDALPTDRGLIQTAPLLRSLILLSGVYIALRNNWSPVFTYKKDGQKKPDPSKPRSRNASVRSPNCSPTPSADRVPFGTTRRNTINFHRRSSTNATISGTSMSTALSGAFTDHSNTEHSIPSRSTTPESRLRRSDNLFNGLVRSATDRFVDKGRQMSQATESGESTTAEGSEFSMPNGARTPTPSGRLGAIDGGVEEPDPVRRASTVPVGILNRASSLRKNWLMPSNPSNDVEFTSHGISDSLASTAAQGGEDGSASPHRRRFSLSRGRARQRPEKTLSMIDHRPPAAYNNQQWWMDWGAEQTASPQAHAVLDDPVERQDPIALPARLVEAERAPQRRSFSINSWRKGDTMERPRSVFITSPSADDKPPIVGNDDSVLQSLGTGEVQKRDNIGFGGLVRRVTHRLRREERKLG